ncbi:DinB family protein [Pontibacter anaerobius]|uniref:DinB family protein n=1 Tax=Pontibacter anaerobius TaxID=2993940 RepID=A0ABT3RBX9_9BACT|nr:DinB family protein [Pontibacter anaerobius]MCX2739032.1 DinB family protein [Pontibacter anaerobius]
MTDLYLQTWQEARSRFTNLLQNISKEDLLKKIGASPNSAGFLVRHIGDVEFLYAKNIFGNRELKVSARTVMAKQDTGEWTNLEELLVYQQQAAEALRAAIKSQANDAWEETITTKEFGTKTKAEAMGRIISHTAYHAGQLALCLKYGVSQ